MQYSIRTFDFHVNSLCSHCIDAVLCSLLGEGQFWCFFLDYQGSKCSTRYYMDGVLTTSEYPHVLSIQLSKHVQPGYRLLHSSYYSWGATGGISASTKGKQKFIIVTSIAKSSITVCSWHSLWWEMHRDLLFNMQVFFLGLNSRMYVYWYEVYFCSHSDQLWSCEGS